MHGMETAYVRATFAEFSWLGTCQMEAGGALAGTRLHGDAMRRERSGSMRRERRSREGNQAVGCGGQEDGWTSRFSCRDLAICPSPLPHCG